jgi:hypothetical protein
VPTRCAASIFRPTRTTLRPRSFSEVDRLHRVLVTNNFVAAEVTRLLVTER